MVLFVNALGGQASFTISLAALTPVTGVSWTYTGLPARNGSGVSFRSSDDSGITFTAFRGFVNNLSNMTVRATLENSTTTAATFDISSGSGAILPATNSFVELGVTNGLVAQYDPGSWNGTTNIWSDKSGNGNNTSPGDVRGVITYDTTNGLLYGSTSDGLKFPALGTTANYTFIHLAKYNNGAKRRIFQGVTENWASGFYDGKSGVAFHNGYITAPTDLYGYNWVISSDQRNLYRAQSVDFTSGTAGSPGYPTRIGLNFGAATTEYSDWAVAEVLIYNRLLTATEMLSVENYLRAKYPSLTIQIDTTTGASFTIPQSNRGLAVGSVVWTFKTPLPAGVSFTGSTQLGASFSIATGTFINNQNMVVTGSGNGGGGTRSLNLLAASRAILETPNVAFDTSDPGSFTVLQTASGTGGVTWAYTNLPASVTFLSSSDAGLTFTVAQNAVVPTRTLTVTATNGLKTPTFASFTYGSGVKPVLAVGTVNAIDSTNSSTFLVPQSVTNALTGGITWSYYPPIFPAGLSVTATNQGATFTVAQNAVIAQQTITVTATNIGGVATSISFIVGAAVKPVLGFTNQLLNTSTALRQFTITVQAPSVTYSGGITWSYTLPTGLIFVTSTNGLITFQVARGTVITSQTFVVTATNSIEIQTAASFTLGAGTPPTLSDPTNGTGELIINTTSVNQTFAVDQQSSRTGTIVWTVTPSSYPAGVSVQSTTDFGITLLLLQGSVLPYQPFVFTATATSGFVATRSFDVGASTLVELQGPGDPQLIDTTTQQTLTVAQIYDPTYTGPVTWTITPSSYPAGISITTQNDSNTIFTFNANSYLTRQQFVFTARSVGGLTSTIQFDIASAVRPTLTNLANQVLDTSTILKTFAVTQQVNTAYTGPIAWTVTPSPFPSGSGMSQVATDGLITFTVPLQTVSTGVVWPNTAFSVTATNINTGYSSTVPTTFDVFVPRLPVVNIVTPSSRILDVSTAAYTSITATQSKSDAVPVYWTITKGDNTAVPAGVSINSSSGLVTIAATSYFAATVLKVIATNSAGAFGSTTFIVTTPAPPAINTVTPSTPQVIDVSDGSQTLTFALTNSGLAGTVVWAYTPLTAGVTINSGTGDFAIAQYTYFTATSFTIKATNAASVTTQRIVSVTTPAVPTVTSPTVSPQTLEVTTQSRTIQFNQSTPLVGTVTWSYTPITSGVAINSNGLLTIDQATYFTATVFTIKATNAVNKFGTMVMNITTPAPPVIDTVTPASGQNIDVSSGAQTFTFTNTASLTGTLVWSYTTSRVGVTINSSSGVLTIAQAIYFTVTTFTIQATNPVNISNTRSFTVTTPTPPVITGPTSTGVIVGSRVYVDTASAKTVSIAQTASDTGTITWSGTGSLPAGVTLTTETNALLEFTIGTTAVLRPAASVFARSHYATNPAGKVSTTISYDVFTPETPALGTPSPAPVSGKIILDTSSTQKTITIPQTVAAANTDPIIWTYPGIGGVSFSESDTQLVATIPAGTFISDGTSVSVSAKNRANMTSGTTSFTLFAPLIAIFTQLDTQYTNTSAGVATFTLPQSRSISANQITYSTSPSAGTLQASGITYGTSGDNLLFSIAQNTIITTPGQSITVFGTNGAGVSVQTSFAVYAGNPPSLANPGNFIFDTTTAQSITVTNNAGPVVTWITPTNFPAGVSFSSSTSSQYVIAVAANSTFGSTSLTVTGKNEFLPAGSSVTFSVAGNKKPVVTTPGTQNLDTTTSAQTFTVSQTSGGTGITWSISSVPGSITLINPSDTSVTVRIAQTTSLAATNIIVTATNIGGSTSTNAFSVAAYYYVAPTVNGIGNYALDSINASTFVTATLSNSGAAGTVTWSIVSGPAGISINSSSGAISIAQGSSFNSTSVTVRASNAAGNGDASFNASATYYVAPTVNGIANFNNLDTTAGSTFVTATLSNSGAAGPVSWSVVSGPVGISINSSSGDISIGQFIIVSDSVTIRATNPSGTGDASFSIIANIKPTLTRITSSPFNVNTYSSGQSLVQLSQLSGGTGISWSMSASPADGRYANLGGNTSGGSIAPFIDVQNDTYCEVDLPHKAVYDSGTQGNTGTITITATNTAGSTSISTSGYAYPYIIYNWTSSIGPETWFGMFFPNKTSGSGGARQYSSYFVTTGVGRLGCFTASNNQVLRYDYTTRRISYQASASVMRGNRNVLTTFETNSGNESMWVYVFPESGQTTVGWWYELSDGSGWRLNGGLSGGNDTQMYQEGDGDINAQIRNLV